MAALYEVAFRVANFEALDGLEPDRDLGDELVLLGDLLLPDADELGFTALGSDGVELPVEAEAVEAAGALGLDVVNQGRGGEGRERSVVATASRVARGSARVHAPGLEVRERYIRSECSVHCFVSLYCPVLKVLDPFRIAQRSPEAVPPAKGSRARSAVATREAMSRGRACTSTGNRPSSLRRA